MEYVVMNKIFRPNTLGLKVATPNGYKDFAGIAYMGDKETIELVLANEMKLECSIDHKIYISEFQYNIASELARFVFKKPLDTVVHAISDKLASPLETLKRRGIPVDRLLKSTEQQRKPIFKYLHL